MVGQCLYRTPSEASSFSDTARPESWGLRWSPYREVGLAFVLVEGGLNLEKLERLGSANRCVLTSTLSYQYAFIVWDFFFLCMI